MSIDLAKTSAALTYEPYFGLNEKPFSLNADSRFVYDSAAFGATRASLLAGIRRREGMLALTGEIGTGKTTLCRAVLRDLGRGTYSSLVPDPFASREDLLKMLLIDFGVTSIQDLAGGSLRQTSRTELGYLLAEFLRSLPPDAFAVVVIDEAQNLSLPLIEEVRILSDTFGAEGRLQIVFAGQPELHAKLKSPEMRQVDQRVCGHYRLTPMTREAVDGYIRHRLKVAGYASERSLFPPDVIEVCHRRSGGVPRLINRLCDRALQLAFERKANGVNRDILDAALMELGAATLSPTWDSIVFAQPAAPTAAAAAATPASAAERSRVAESAAPAADSENLKKDLADWTEEQVQPQVRTQPTPVPAPAVEAPATTTRRPQVAPRQSTIKRGSQSREVFADWSRDVRSETYVQRIFRLSMKRAAVAAAVVLVAISAAVPAGWFLADAQTTAELPAPPKPPSLGPGLALPAPAVAATPTSTSTSGSTPTSNVEAPVTAAASAAPDATEDYLVAVGLFVSRDYTDQLVDTLTKAGLPAMQRQIQFRGRQMQQIALGPFFSRADAVADLERLKQLGGYSDARVISSSQ